MEKERRSNFELMRIISMFFIVLYHVIYHGNVIDLATNTFAKFILQVIELITIVHVNSFVLLTGYFQCKSKFKFSKLVKLLLVILFYLTVLLFLLILFKKIDFSLYDILNYYIKSINSYWFFKYYILLYLFSPFINKFILSVSSKKFLILLVIFFMIFSLYPILFGISLLAGESYFIFGYFIFIYLLGAYLRLYFHERKVKFEKYRIWLVFLFVGCIIINYVIYLIFNQFKGGLYKYTFLNYNNVFVIMQSACYFLFFSTFNFNSKKINFLSRMMFGIYLIHDSFYVRKHLYNWVQIDCNFKHCCYYVLFILFVAVLIFCLSLIIEMVRYFICNYLFNREKGEKFYKNLDSLIIYKE